MREHGTPTYPVGLRLVGREVVIVGGGSVAQRRIPALVAAGAHVRVVSPQVRPAIEGMAQAGELTWTPREYADGDLAHAWYAVAATDRPEVNAGVVAEAERHRVFCVRADDAEQGTALTPASGAHDGVMVAVMGASAEERDPRRSARLRDRFVADLREDTRLRPPQGRAAAGVVLIGGGPGDPDLITVAGRRALMEADVVVADRLAPRELLGQLPADTEIIDVTKLPRGRAATQEEINRVLIDRAREGKRVARFKGGDNFVFGRGYEEVLACQEAGVPVSVIPGISSPLAVPALAGIPVTHRGVTHELTIVSGHLAPDHPASLVDWDALARMRGTVVLMMAVDNAPAIARRMLAAGRSPETPVGIVCDGSMPTERTVLATLDTLAERIRAERVSAPAIIVIGEVVGVSVGAPVTPAPVPVATTTSTPSPAIAMA